MNLTHRFCFISLAFVCLCIFFVSPSISGEQAKNDTTFEQGKTDVLKGIETFEHSLTATKSCISGARTSEELNKCLIDEARIKFQHIQDLLSEMGMSWEERKLQRLKRD